MSTHVLEDSIAPGRYSWHSWPWIPLVASVAVADVDAGWLLNRAAPRDSGGATVLLPRLPTPYASCDDLAADMAKAGADLGWDVQTAKSKDAAGWVTARNRKGRLAVSVGIRNLLSTGDALVRPELAQVEAGVLCEGWHRLTLTHYHHTPGAAMSGSIMATLKGCRRVLQDPATAEYWQPPAHIPEWRITPRHRPPDNHLHQWDMRAAYLAAAAAADLPRRKLVPVGPGDIDLQAPGYVRVKVPPQAPHWWRWLGRQDRHGTIWTVTPLARLMSQPEIIEGWMPRGAERDRDMHGRLLRSWAEMIRDAITGDIDPILRGALKAGYAQAIGLLAVPSGGLYRPDWRHLIVGTMQASMLRRLIKVYVSTGQWPLEINVDAVTYATDDPRIIHDTIGCGDHIGQMVYKGVADHE